MTELQRMVRNTYLDGYRQALVDIQGSLSRGFTIKDAMEICNATVEAGKNE